MAILPINLYSDWLLTRAGQAIIPGVAAATGWASDPSHWWHYNYYATHGDILTMNGKTLSQNEGILTLSGGAAIYDNNISDMIPYGDNIDTDLISPNAALWPNGFFTGRDDTYAFSLSISSNSATGNSYNIRMGYYTQQPEEATGTARTNWNYLSTYFDFQWNSICTPWNSSSGYFTSAQQQTRVYKLFLGNEAYFLFAFGVSADGTYSSGGVSSNGSCFLAIPLAYFKDKESRPWAGDESEDNAEESYFPTTPYTDTISSRDLTGKRNPYGFNTGNGMKLAVIGYESYAKILQGIYCGTAEGLLNKIAQAYYELTGGNDHRQAEEIQSIVSAVLCCHLIPKITGILSDTMKMRTIAGYHIFGQNLYGGQYITVGKTDNTIFGYSSPPSLIEPRLNSFLDFEPYTSITLHLPFMASVNLQPSALYGNYLYVHYEIDVYTGILSADIIIHESGGREYIISTQQANVRTEIPIMGNGANGAPLAQIASSVLGVARSGSPELAAAAGIVSGVDELSKASTGVAVGRNTVEGIGTYLSSRSAYLIITRPEPANPSNFLEMEGSTANLPGKVGDFTGFSIFDDVKLEGFSATDDEKKSIEALLKGGVFV